MFSHQNSFPVPVAAVLHLPFVPTFLYCLVSFIAAPDTRHAPPSARPRLFTHFYLFKVSTCVTSGDLTESGWLVGDRSCAQTWYLVIA